MQIDVATVYRPYVDVHGVGCGHRAVVPIGKGKGGIRVIDLGLLRTYTVPAAAMKHARAAPLERPNRTAARLERLRRCLKRSGTPHAETTAKAVIAAMRALHTQRRKP